MALQGDVVEHMRALEAGGTRAREVKTERDLRAVDALIIPGGESTTVIKLLNRFGLVAPIKARVHAGMPLWGTCMGMIVAAHDVADLDQETLDLIDITVRRNAFGRQIASAEVELDDSDPGCGAVSRHLHSRAVDRARRAGRRRACVSTKATESSCARAM